MEQAVQDRINKLAERLREAGQKINLIVALPENEVINNADRINSLRHHLIAAIETTIDICYYAAAQRGRPIYPQEYGHCFSRLEEKGVGDKKLGAPLAKLANFRNSLIYAPWQVDSPAIYRTAKESVSVFEAFTKALGGLSR